MQLYMYSYVLQILTDLSVFSMITCIHILGDDMYMFYIYYKESCYIFNLLYVSTLHVAVYWFN